MSAVGDTVRRATEAGRWAAQMAPFVHCDPLLRNAIRAELAAYGNDSARAVLAELETSWVLVDNGQWPGLRRRR